MDERQIDFIESDIDECASKFYNYSKSIIEKVDKATLHKLLGSSSLQLETEESLLRLLIELGCDYFEFWNYVEVSMLSPEGISLFAEHLPFDFVTETIWLGIISRLKGEKTSNHHNHRHRTQIPIVHSIRFTSTILNEIPTILNDVMKKGSNLKYRGTRDGFKSTEFHQKCDGCVNTITLIETTKGYIFGGFTKLQWDSSNSWKRDDNRESFLFTIRNPHNLSARKFALSNPSYAICCSGSYGPIFGNGNDIFVSDSSNMNANSCSNLGTGYVNDTGINGNQVFTGEFHFTVKEIEVFTIED
jgi:hypothetical protein